MSSRNIRFLELGLQDPQKIAEVLSSCCKRWDHVLRVFKRWEIPSNSRVTVTSSRKIRFPDWPGFAQSKKSCWSFDQWLQEEEQDHVLTVYKSWKIPSNSRITVTSSRKKGFLEQLGFARSRYNCRSFDQLLQEEEEEGQVLRVLNSWEI